MNVLTVFGTVVVCFYCFHGAQCFVEILPWAGGVLGVIAESVCRFTECCTDEYIPGDLNLLRTSLSTELYGQHLADTTVVKALEAHIHNVTPKKALAMSFHGAVGTGKDHMVNLILAALYKNGANSNYVHHYEGQLHFYATDKIAEYENQILSDIKKHLGSCPRSIFIFNGVDFMPKGMLDVLLPFLDYNPRVLNVNPTEAIFIFITNIGSASIEKQLIEMWESGTKREDTKLNDFQSLLSNEAYKGQGGLHETDIIEMNLIDYYVPFLPLEKDHVRKCIDADFKKRNLELTNDLELSELIDEAMTHMTFVPPMYNLFSQSGCKRVNSKVSAIVEQSRFTNPSIP